MNYLLIFIGGGLGSLARFAISKAFISYKGFFPWGTFAANFLACLVLAYFIGIEMKSELPASYRFFVAVGFCGGFSTFSTFSLESYKLIQEGNIFIALTYIFASVIICWGAIILGLRLS